MTIKQKLIHHIANPLEWSSSRKTALLLWMYLFDQLLYTAFIVLGQYHPLVAPWFDQRQAALHSYYFMLLMVTSAALLVLVHFTPPRYRNNVAIEYMGCLFFGLTHVYYGYCVGLMSLPVGVVLVGTPVVGFIFLDLWAVATAFVASLLLVVVLSTATLMEQLPYAPLLQNLYRADGQMEAIWVISYSILASPHLFFIFTLAYYVLQRWRVREQQVVALSRTDSLTGLINRRHIVELLSIEKTECESLKLPLSVVMVDLDHFKKINDGWGHDVGDRALIAAAAALRSAVRQNDHVGRYGGEEFLVVLPGLDATQARMLAERIRTTIAATVLELPNNQCLSLSASLGMSCVAVADEVTVEHLIKQADLALYRAKDSGRDQLVVAA